MKGTTFHAPMSSAVGGSAAAASAAGAAEKGPSLVFDQVSENVNFVKLEETVLQHWTDIDAFQTSLKMSEGRPIYTFYDGPPFATGLPHYGHILAGTIKVRCTSSGVPRCDGCHVGRVCVHV